MDATTFQGKKAVPKSILKNKMDKYMLSQTKKTILVLAVVVLAILFFCFFWIQNLHRINYSSESQNQTQEINEAKPTEEEIEKQKMDEMYAMMEKGYTWAFSGKINTVDWEKGIMEVEVDQAEKEKNIRVSLNDRTEILRVDYKEKEVSDGLEKNKSFREEGIEPVEYEEDKIKSQKTDLHLGMFVQVKALEMFRIEETDSIDAALIYFSPVQE
jgi:hypothetical protein